MTNIYENKLLIQYAQCIILKKFLWNQLFSNFFSENVDLTEKRWYVRRNRDRVLVLKNTVCYCNEKQFDITKFWKNTSYLQFSYSVSSLETTIFRQNRIFFRRTFLSPWLIPYFVILMGGKRGHVLPPIRVTKCRTHYGLRKVNLKLTLTSKIISRKIVVSRVETLYVISLTLLISHFWIPLILEFEAGTSFAMA